MGYLTREQILTRDDLRTVEVYVHQWGGKICLKELNGFDRSEYENYAKRVFEQSQNYSEAIAELILKCAVDAEGKPLFDQADLEALQKKSSGALLDLYYEACKLNKLGEADVEEQEKNSEPTQDEPSVLS